MKPINDKHLMKITQRPEAVMVRGEGSYLWDHHGKKYLDFIQGWAVNALGHAPPELQMALTQQSQLLVTPSPAFHNAPQLELAELLATLSGLDQVHFSNSGAEANEVAVKLARKWGQLHRNGAYEIVTTHDAFHGRTLAMMAASGKPGWDRLFPPLPPGFRKVRYGDASAMADAIGPHVAAIMVEPIQGEAGCVVPPPDYLKQLRKLADEHDVLLILDEIQTGMGRTGSLFAYQSQGVEPDILTVGKGLGAGFPVSATLAKSRASCFQLGDQGGTFNGNPLGTAVGREVVKVVSQPEFLERVNVLGRYLKDRLEHMTRSWHGASIRGRGLLWGVELGAPRACEIRDAAFEMGLIVNAARPSILRLMPSLRVTEAEIDEAVATLERVMGCSMAKAS